MWPSFPTLPFPRSFFFLGKNRVRKAQEEVRSLSWSPSLGWGPSRPQVIRSLGHCHPDTKETGSSILISTQSIRARNQQGPVYMHTHQSTRQTPSDPNDIPRVLLLMHSDASWRNRHGYRELTATTGHRQWQDHHMPRNGLFSGTALYKPYNYPRT